ncbi:hypothetical protein BD311DRAFT_37878 [Dichomitus squalens]|uniref:Uncharacterized protein n=1 Tax=Dichomitus squalens TaxID=114155 RepID=A0A4Q9MCM9_9APHY|nr:hypothetical protein BD311DRAFT_37878 [Dichomitus squalens]TBU56436.1 hypothetical protein BD310DRAFT_612886 [Dichomitus squalens]
MARFESDAHTMEEPRVATTEAENRGRHKQRERHRALRGTVYPQSSAYRGAGRHPDCRDRSGTLGAWRALGDMPLDVGAKSFLQGHMGVRGLWKMTMPNRNADPDVFRAPRR